MQGIPMEHPIHIRGGDDIDKSDLARPGSGAAVHPVATEDQRDVHSPSPPMWSRQLNSLKNLSQANSMKNLSRANSTPKSVANAKLKAKIWRGKVDQLSSIGNSGNIIIGAPSHGRRVSLLGHGAERRPIKRSSFDGTSGPRMRIGSSRRTSVSEAFFRRASIEPESIEIFHSAKETSTKYVLHPNSFTRRFIDLVAGLNLLSLLAFSTILPLISAS
jgi:hypothetical protein